MSDLQTLAKHLSGRHNQSSHGRRGGGGGGSAKNYKNTRAVVADVVAAHGGGSKSSKIMKRSTVGGGTSRHTASMRGNKLSAAKKTLQSAGFTFDKQTTSDSGTSVQGSNGQYRVLIQQSRGIDGRNRTRVTADSGPSTQLANIPQD